MALSTAGGMVTPTVSAVQIDQNSSAATTFTPTGTAWNTLAPKRAGATVVIAVAIASSSVSVTTISGFGGATFVRQSQGSIGAALRFEVWQAVNVGPGNVGVYTISLSGSAVVESMMAIVEDSPQGILQSGFSNGTGTTMTTPVLTPSEANTQVIAFFGNKNSGTGYAATRPTGSTSTTAPENFLVRTGGGTITWGGIIETADVVGPLPISVTRSLGGSVPWWVGLIVMRAATVSTDDYTYQFGTGPLMNDPNSNTLPIYDVEKVSGLSDIQIASDTSDVDGVDGGVVSANFRGTKPVVLEGTLYAAAPVNESLIDTFRDGFAPSKLDKPLYIKPPGQARRALFGKVTNFQADIDQGRARGVIPFQATIEAGDPNVYGDWKAVSLPKLTFVSGGAAPTVVTNNGKATSYPIVYYWHYYASEGGPSEYLYLANYTWTGVNTQLKIPLLGISAVQGLYKIDFGTKMITCMGTAYGASTVIIGPTDPNWWGLLPGPNLISMYKTTAPIVNEPATMYYRDAWM
jgi:hypothetical protein